MPVAAQQFTVAVVDDDEGFLRLTSEILAGEGHHVLTARSGPEAIRLIRQARPDLLLLDLQLQDSGGAALLSLLEAEQATVPFIVITGQGDERIAVEMMKRGALDYIIKNTAVLELLGGVVRRALAAREAERNLAEAQAERDRLQREVIAISEQEQRRIGADLHDDLGQQLTALELMCASLKADVVPHPELAAQVSQISRGLRQAVAHVRALAHGLVPVSDEPDSLYLSLVQLVERTNQLRKLQCRFECPGPILLGHRVIAGHLYRIAQESVTNALKYSRGTTIVVRLAKDGPRLTLGIADDGAGLRTGRRPGIGMAVMKHRAKEIGAELTIQSRRGHGVTVTCSLALTD